MLSEFVLALYGTIMVLGRRQRQRHFVVFDSSMRLYDHFLEL